MELILRQVHIPNRVGRGFKLENLLLYIEVFSSAEPFDVIYRVLQTATSLNRYCGN